MTAPINGTVTPPALYTVEQLELIRRLRNSGISREDVANAFDTFDRLDRELGPVYNIPVTLVSYLTHNKVLTPSTVYMHPIFMFFIALMIHCSFSDSPNTTVTFVCHVLCCVYINLCTVFD